MSYPTNYVSCFIMLFHFSMYYTLFWNEAILTIIASCFCLCLYTDVSVFALFRNTRMVEMYRSLSSYHVYTSPKRVFLQWGQILRQICIMKVYLFHIIFTTRRHSTWSCSFPVVIYYFPRWSYSLMINSPVWKC